MADAYCTDDVAFYQARIDATKALIIAYEDAILALSTGTFQYTLDTGQTRQTVTKQQISQLKTVLDGLYNRLETLRARICGTSFQARPGF